MNLDMAPQAGTEEVVKELLCAYVSLVKAMQGWFHAAHHVVKGTGFAGDHELLYSEIYGAFTGDLDGIIEKSIGLTGDENIACPLKIAEGSLEVMRGWKTPSGQSSETIAKCALELELDFIDVSESLFELLDEAGVLSLGLNDFLAALANKHEGFVYKLRQRTR